MFAENTHANTVTHNETRLEKRQIVWLAEDNPPFLFNAKTGKQGLYYDVLLALTSRLNLSLSIKPTPIRRVYTSLINNHGDMIIVPRSIWEAQKANFVKSFSCDTPFLSFSASLYAVAGRFTGPISDKELAQHTVFYYRSIKRWQDNVFHPSQSVSKLPQKYDPSIALLSGEIDILMAHELTLYYGIKDATQITNIFDKKLYDEVLLCFSHAFLERQGEGFLSSVTRVLEELRQDKVLERHLNNTIYGFDLIDIGAFISSQGT